MSMEQESLYKAWPISNPVLLPDEWLDMYAQRLVISQALLARKKQGEPYTEFDIRSPLYDLHFDIAPDARRQDLMYIEQRLQPQRGEVIGDVAAGTGYITHDIVRLTQAPTFAIDASRKQLEILENNKINRPFGNLITSIVGNPDTESFLEDVKAKYGTDLEGKFDALTSYGGIHHMWDHQVLFQNFYRMLKKDGRLVFGDVGKGSRLALHFDTDVRENSITGHEGNWLSVESAREYSKGYFELKDSREVPVQWIYNNTVQGCIAIPALHGYRLDFSDKSPSEKILTFSKVLDGIQRTIGFTSNGIYDFKVNWPMQFFDFRRIDTKSTA